MRRFEHWEPLQQVTICDKCGERYAEGDWMFCKSRQNPEGHSRGAYAFTMKFPMKTNGWTRRER